MRRLSVLLVGACLAGCSAVGVHRDDGQAVEGIPFNTKVPVEYQNAKWFQRNITVSLKLNGKLDGKEVSWDYPGTPLQVPQTPAVMVEVKKLQDLATTSENEALMTLQILAIQSVGDAEMQATLNGADSSAMRLLTNTRTVEVELSPHQYYLRPRMPWVGSSQYELGLNDKDGSMSKASGNVKDDTISTLASIIPVNAYFSKQLGLKAGSNVKGFQQAHNQTLTDAKLVLDISMTSVIYTLRKRLDGSKCVWGPPPTVADARKGECVQLVATEAIAPDAPARREQPKPGYEISGKITLPEQKPQQ